MESLAMPSEIDSLIKMSYQFLVTNKLINMNETEFYKFFIELDINKNYEAILYCIEEFILAEIDFKSSGNRGLGRMSTSFPRLGAYLRKSISKLNNSKRNSLFILLKENILFSYVVQASISPDLLPVKKITSEELYRAWIPVIYAGGESILRSNYDVIMLLTSYTRDNLARYLRTNKIKGGGLFSKDLTFELLTMHIEAGLRLRAIELGQIK